MYFVPSWYHGNEYKENEQYFYVRRAVTEFDDSVKKFISKKGVDKAFGARPLRRTIQNLVEDKLAEAILDGVMKKGQKTKVEVKDGKVIVK